MEKHGRGEDLLCIYITHLPLVFKDLRRSFTLSIKNFRRWGPVLGKPKLYVSP